MEKLTFKQERDLKLLKSGNYRITLKGEDFYKEVFSEYIENGELTREVKEDSDTIIYYGGNTFLDDTIEVGSIVHSALKIILVYHNLPETYDIQDSFYIGDFRIDYNRSLRESPIVGYTKKHKQAVTKKLLMNVEDLSFLDVWKFGYKDDCKTNYFIDNSLSGEVKTEISDSFLSSNDLESVITYMWRCMSYHNLLDNFPRPESFNS